MIWCLLLGILVSLIGRSCSQTTIIRDVVPNSILVFQSNQYDSNLPCLNDPQCSRLASTDDDKKRSSEGQALLICPGPSSPLFDGIIGRDIGGGGAVPEEIDLLRHYTWQQGITPNPYVAMSFDLPLEEVSNVTMYFYHEGRLGVQPPFISMCFSRSLNFSPCTNIQLPPRPDRLDNRVLVWPIPLLTNITSVTYLRIDMQHEDDDDSDEFIFLSEIRIAERLQVPTTAPTPTPISSIVSTPIPAVTQTPPAIEDKGNNVINIAPMDTPSPTVDNEMDNITNITFEETSREENRYRSKLIIGLSVSFVIIIAIVIFFIVLMVWIIRRQKKRKSEQMPEIPIIVGSLQSDQTDVLNKEQNLNNVPVQFTRRKTTTGQPTSQRSITDRSPGGGEYCTVVSPAPPPVYDYVGTEINLFGEEMELDIYSSPDCTGTAEYQSFDTEGCYSEPTLEETEYWDNVDDDVNPDHPYDDIGVAPYHSVYAEPEPLEKSNPPLAVTWDNVKPLEALGSGQFGAVVLSEVLHLTEEQLGLSRGYVNVSAPILVAIKTLKKDPTEQNKKAFEKEIKFMSRLNHKNVIRLLGICTKGTPFIMMEYMENGDLNQFLKKHTFAPRYEMEAEGSPTVNQKILIYISLQIAGGMQYLSGRKFIHRDLATRNILVGNDFAIKVADFGMSQNLYSGYYFRIKGHQVLPIRWLPFESFKGKFSVKSDVWSFGVTMWEIFTVCKKRPYQGWTDRAVIRDAMKEENRTLLEQTEHCSDEVYTIMKSCWKHNPHSRSNFNNLYSQLYNLYNKL